MRWKADRELILIVVARSSPWGTAWKNSLRSSIEGGMTIIIRIARQLENRHFDEVTDDLGINSDDMATNGGLKYQPVVIVLHHL
jgi:hypothetical protein